MKVLLIDDSEAQRESTSALLELGGHEVTAVASGEAGLAALPQVAPDVVLCDLEMPGIDGVAVVRHLVEARCPVPVIVLTGNGEVHRVIEVMKQGAFSYLIKGTAPELLLKEVEDAAEMHRLVLRSGELEAANRLHREHLEELVERKTRELAENQRRRAEAEKLATLGTLVAGVAHEFNNPLAVIISNMKFIGDHLVEIGSSDVDVGDAIREVEMSANRMAGLVKRLLLFGRTSDRGFCDTRDAIASSLAIARLQIEHVPVDVVLAEDVPQLPLRPDDAITTFCNLIVNAAHAMTGRRGRITVGVEKGGVAGSVRLWVEDQGIGIPQEHLARVCDPFFTTKPPGSGTGLGLAQVQEIARGAGGSISIRSEPGVGTRITIDVPGHTVASEADPRPSSATT